MLTVCPVFGNAKVIKGSKFDRIWKSESDIDTGTLNEGERVLICYKTKPSQVCWIHVSLNITLILAQYKYIKMEKNITSNQVSLKTVTETQIKTLQLVSLMKVWELEKLPGSGCLYTLQYCSSVRIRKKVYATIGLS